MSRGRHCKPSAMRRGLTVATVGAAAVALTSGMAVASTPAQSLDCADANLAYSQAAAHEQDTSKALADAKAADAAAIDKKRTAITDAQAAYKDSKHTDADKKALADAKAAAEAEYVKGGTADRLNAAQAAENSAAADRDAKHDAANKACKGADGKDGKDGTSTIVDTIVALRPGACVRAQVRKDTNKIVRVIVAVPCPTKPAPPPAQASESTPSTVTPAPVPQTQEMDGTAPKVTH